MRPMSNVMKNKKKRAYSYLMLSGEKKYNDTEYVSNKVGQPTYGHKNFSFPPKTWVSMGLSTRHHDVKEIWVQILGLPLKPFVTLVKLLKFPWNLINWKKGYNIPCFIKFLGELNMKASTKPSDAMCSALPLPSKSLPTTWGTESSGCLTTTLQTQQSKNAPAIPSNQFLLEKYTWWPTFVNHQWSFLLPYSTSNQSINLGPTSKQLSYFFLLSPMATTLVQVSIISLLDYCSFCWSLLFFLPPVSTLFNPPSQLS